MGRMGRALAGRLLETGHDVRVWNRSAGKASELVDRGAKEAATIGEAVTGVDLAISILANDDAVKAVALDDGGIRSALPEDAAYVDSSTVAPATSDELAEAFTRFVAMPILGPPTQVEAGQAVYLVGASDSSKSAVAPLLPDLSDKQISYDTPSAAAVAKLTVNLLLLDGLAALAEAFAGGRAGGLSDDQLRELLASSPMLAPGLKPRFEGVLTGEQDPFWTLGLGAKDARLAVDVAKSAGVDLPVTKAVQGQYEQAAARFDDADIAAVGKLYR